MVMPTTPNPAPNPNPAPSDPVAAPPSPTPAVPTDTSTPAPATPVQQDINPAGGSDYKIEDPVDEVTPVVDLDSSTSTISENEPVKPVSVTPEPVLADDTPPVVDPNVALQSDNAMEGGMSAPITPAAPVEPQIDPVATPTPVTPEPVNPVVLDTNNMSSVSPTPANNTVVPNADTSVQPDPVNKIAGDVEKPTIDTAPGMETPPASPAVPESDTAHEMPAQDALDEIMAAPAAPDQGNTTEKPEKKKGVGIMPKIVLAILLLAILGMSAVLIYLLFVD